mmetsp:Transcript_18265/g.28382  ORF Transcript_18265/g.28382 Transcript_18265/m.28382 type:complete len:385 (-) Transcript_18265:3635-4789(-)
MVKNELKRKIRKKLKFSNIPSYNISLMFQKLYPNFFKKFLQILKVLPLLFCKDNKNRKETSRVSVQFLAFNLGLFEKLQHASDNNYYWRFFEEKFFLNFRFIKKWFRVCFHPVLFCGFSRMTHSKNWFSELKLLNSINVLGIDMCDSKARNKQFAHFKKFFSDNFPFDFNLESKVSHFQHLIFSHLRKGTEKDGKNMLRKPKNLKTRHFEFMVSWKKNESFENLESVFKWEKNLFFTNTENWHFYFFLRFLGLILSNRNLSSYTTHFISTKRLIRKSLICHYICPSILGKIMHFFPLFPIVLTIQNVNNGLEYNSFLNGKRFRKLYEHKENFSKIKNRIIKRTRHNYEQTFLLEEVEFFKPKMVNPIRGIFELVNVRIKKARNK